MGYPGVTANVTNTVALWPGYVGATAAYRRERGATLPVGGPRHNEHRRWGRRVSAATHDARQRLQGGRALSHPARLRPFRLQPLAARTLAKRRTESKEHRSAGLHVAVFLAAVYGAYFGAGLGIILLAVLGLVIADTLQRLNGLKQVLSVVINSVAVIAYGAFGPVAWTAVAIMAVASLAGGRIGGGFARRLSPTILRVVVVCFGVTVGCILLARQ